MGDTLRLIVQNTTQAHQQHQGPEPNQYSSFKDFQDTKPPIFKVAEEPLQVDEWLNTIDGTMFVFMTWANFASKCWFQLKYHFHDTSLTKWNNSLECLNGCVT